MCARCGGLVAVAVRSGARAGGWVVRDTVGVMVPLELGWWDWMGEGSRKDGLEASDW